MAVMRRVLVTGASGMVGQAMLRCVPADVEVVATMRATPVSGVRVVEVDLAEARQTARVMERVRPDVVVHLAYDKSRDAVVDPVRHLVASGVPVLFASTDMVFSGDGRPRAEHDLPDPVNPYGVWKAEAEALVLTSEHNAIARLPLMVHLDPPDPNSRQILDATLSGVRLTWYRDEVRQPAWVDDVAAAMWQLARPRVRPGIWHLPGPDLVSRPELGAVLSAHLGVADPGDVVPSPSATERPRDLRLTAARAIAELRWSPRSVLDGTAVRPSPR